LWADGERVFCRTWREADGGERKAMLAVVPASEHPSPRCLDSLAHEYGLKDMLNGTWALRPLALERDRGSTMLILEDPGGEPLERLLDGPMAVGDFLPLAIGIAASLGKLHARDLVHKDLKPAHLLVNCPDDQVRLTGFGLASRLPSERRALASPEFIAGTLAYMAPEQTGWMNRSVDSRSDLYALGVVFYRILTGSLPFTASDPMGWVHCHIARKPVTPRERLENIPAQVSNIVMKLLAKTAEERYQTTSGVERDLRRCLVDWERRGRIDGFPLGEYDTPNRLLIPEKLYGRAHEVETLLTAFDRIVENGAPELVLISGYSGIGKSSVVNELHRALMRPHSLFASGKFEQYKRDIPYAPLGQAFQGLIRPLLGLSEAELSGWRNALREALEPNAQLMVELVPELRLITGEPPPLLELAPQQAQSRFQQVFRRFLCVFARPEHPLVLFLDDLQWLDAATLDLLEDLLTQPEVKHLLLIGAYRDNEVLADHPLARKLETMHRAKVALREIKLAPLAGADMRQLIADTLRCGPEEAAPLAQLVHEKTGGNPFFVVQFLHALDDEGLLAFDHGKGRWRWDLNRIHAKGYTANVVDFMVAKLTRLPRETQAALQLLACLGNGAEGATLALIRGTAEEAIHADLWEAVRQKLILHIEGVYNFAHDRVQEAAYSLIPQSLREAAHLRIGRFLAAYTPPGKRDEAIFEIINQLNRGASLITEGEERQRLAELNLIAGKRAKLSTAYAEALTCLAAGAALLPEDAWERQHELIFALELARAECEFLTGALAEAEQRLATLSTRAANTMERATVACLRVDLYTTLDQSSRAIAVALDYLRQLGVDWAPHATEEEARREYERIWSQLGGRSIEDLIELPLMSDAASLATLDVLTKVLPPAMFTDANLATLIICRAVNLSLERGNSDGSCFAYVMLGMVAGARFGDDQRAYRFGQLGYDLVEGPGLKRFQARTYMNFGNVVLPWRTHVRAGRDLVRRGFEAARKVGDLTYAAYARYMMVTNLLAAGDQLFEVQCEAESGLAFVQKAQFGFAIDIINTQLGLVRTLRGLTPRFGSFDDGQFDELLIERRFSSNPDLARVECWYWIRKLQARFLAGDYEAAIDASSRAQRLLWTSPSLFETAEYHFYSALSQALLCDSAVAGERQGRLAAIGAHHNQLLVWAANCPDNFENRAALIGAEVARVEGHDREAMDLYEQAIRSAEANGFVHNEALANELAAHFYTARGFEKIARMYLQNARYGYLRWGADGKVRQLDDMYPYLREDEAAPVPTSTIEAPVGHLDLATVMKVSQAVSGEIVLEKLIDTLMHTAVEQAGAERGLLILAHGAELRIEAQATTDDDTVVVEVGDQPVTAAVLPESVLNYVLRTRESIILDAPAPPRFSSDPYLRCHQTLSVLCLPLITQTKLIGLLYLENSLASGVFARGRITVLKLLASQAAVALEISRLYADLRLSEDRWRNLFENIPVGVNLIDSDGRYVAANQAFQKMTGYTEAELRNLSPVDVAHEDDSIATEARIVASAAGTSYPQHVVKRCRCKDGSVIWVDVSAFVTPVVSGAPLLAGAMIDITDRKRAEEDLRRSEASLAQAQQISRTGSWRWNVATGEVSSSAELLRIFGFDPKKTPLSYGTFMARIHPDDRSSFEHALDQAVRNRSRFQYECRIVLPDGPVKYLHSVGQPGGVEGSAPEFVGTVMDITERRVAEEALRNAQAELVRVARLTTMGELLASIAHEINQPLAAVAADAGACLRWLNRDQPDLASARNAVSRVARDAHRAGDVIRSLRALSKKSGPQLITLDIRDTIEEVLALTQGELRQHGVVLHKNLSAGDRPVWGDRVQLQQVVLNLIMNAIQAMAAVTDRRRELTVSATRAERGRVQVAVEDTGPGLDPAIAQRIFDPFFTTKPDGLGIGLSICRSIIEGHGGKLGASFREPHGTAFHFTIPLARDV
jgi:PAS domain S-box-containing protein